MKKEIKVLHIDDSYLDRMLVKDILSQDSTDFILQGAETREKFEELISQQIFDIILSDFNILGFDGLQVLEVIKKTNPDLPVVIITGTGSEEVAIKAMKMGAADYVIKSVKHIRSLPQVIINVLEHKQKEIELNKTQNALFKSEALFRTAFENATIGVCMVDIEGKFISVNKTLCEITGYSRSELEKSSFLKITHPDDLERSHSFLLKILNGDINYTNFEKRYLHKSGKIIWAIMSTSLIKNELNEPEYFFTFIQDISEKKKFEEELIQAKEKAEESDRLKTAFLNNISHEIRTPMNAIIGFSELLNEPNLDKDKHKEYTNTIMQSSEHLLSIISDIISIATIEAGQEKTHNCEFNLNEILDLLYDQFKIKAFEKNLNLKIVKTLSDKDALITSDKTKLIQVISNLVNNALKYTDTGFIEVCCELKKDQLFFTVKDSGIGIPKEMHEEIFKRFRQIENPNERHHGGSGLGLAISKAYIELLNGQIWLNSEPNQGTSFFFTIPYTAVNSQKYKTSLKESNETLVLNRKIKNILIAEDDDSNFLLIKTFLSDNNVKILRVKTGSEAVEMCRNNNEIDIVLMDIKMPQENGLEAIKKIRKFNTQIPIIIESAYYDDSNREEAYAAGCNDFITKPIKKHKLISVINKLFN